MTLPGQLALQSSESCVMWPIPEGEVTQYYILYNNTTITLNYTTNWHCFELNQIQGTITAVQVCASASLNDQPPLRDSLVGNDLLLQNSMQGLDMQLH